MNAYGEHCAPAIGAGPALEPIRNTSLSVIFLCTAIITLENVMPVMIGTFSFSISLSTSWVATSGLSWLSSLMHLHRHAAELAAVLLDDHHEARRTGPGRARPAGPTARP